MAQERTAVREVAIERRSAAAATVQRSAAAPAPTSAARALQQRLGNQGTQALVARSVAASAVQRLAKVSSPSDPAELEAHDTARKVMRMAAPAPAVVAPGAGATPSIQRAAAPPPAPAAAAPVHVPSAGGAPLPESVRGFMEPRFGAGFGDVRIHTGESAARQSAELNAHAFTVGKHVFFGRDKFQPDSAAGKELIAHELTHTIQQGAAVQRSADTTVSQRTPPQVQRLSFGIGAALDYAADKANYIPGFRLLTIVLGMNPVNLAPVERNAANLLRALLELIPVTGPLLVQALEAHGVIARAGAWIDAQVRTLGLVGSALKRALDAFLDSLSWRDIGDLGGVWERAKRIFTEPIGRLLEFGKSLAVEILRFVREAVLLPLARLAEGTRGYDLLKAVLGEDPITGQPVARSPDNLIGGFMKLIGKEEIWENIKKANAVPRAWAWFQGALTALMGYVRQIPALFSNALKALEVIDFLLLPKAFVKLAGVFGAFVVEFFTWAGHAAYALLEIVFEVLAPKAIPYLKKVAGAFRKILDNPIEFVGHLIDAAKLGFQQFADNFGQHLKTSIIEWLTGSLPGVYIPQKLELGEIVKFVFSVLGLTWQNIRQKLVKVVGETAVKAMEMGFDIVVTLVTEGPAAAWEKIKDQLANLKDMVIGGIVDFITESIVKKAVAKVLSLLVPGGAFIQAILSIYDTVMVFIDKLQKIIQVATAFLDSMMDIASGKIEGAAKKVETTLAGLLTLAISFLAGFLGLGKIADKVMDLINTKVRAPIDKAIDFLIDWIVKAAKSLFAKVTGKKDERTDEEKAADLDKALSEAEAIRAKPNISEFDIRKELPAIKKKYNMASLDLVVDAEETATETVHFEGGMSPNKAGKPAKIAKQADKETKIVHQTGSVGPYKAGMSMTVDWLGPKHPAGSPPTALSEFMDRLVTDPSKHSPDKFIRGHLLNENLGGPGTEENLFPITANANSQHLHSTETDIKKWVNESGKWAWYEVKVQDVSYKLDAAGKSPKNWVNCTFACHYVLKEATGEVKKDVSTSIPSTYKYKEIAEKTDNL
jgi:hypothetical protein